MNGFPLYNVIVVGGGHAGCEAALAAARLGARTLLLTMNMDHIAQMSCNPAIGGIAKGQVVREIDALGGAMAKIADAATLQFRLLNSRKGPAVWSPRAQCDKVCYQRAMKRELELHENLDIHQATATELLLENGEIRGVVTNYQEHFKSDCVVLANGTFLRGKLHYGMLNMPGGRAGDAASNELSVFLIESLKLRLGRLKTGTPPRILAKTIDFSKMRRQDGETYDEYFSHFTPLGPSGFSADQDGGASLDRSYSRPRCERRDMPCFMVNSTAETARIVNENLDKSPMYQGVIEGIGTRYCPSFEDKIVRFPHHETHQLYLEPEGEFTEEYYINGISTSLPTDVQVKLINSIPGMENAIISRYAYAIEYDFIFPDQIDRSLRVKRYPNLFLAGQINGTSGYEEAAGQGLIAGLNAARTAMDKEVVEIPRDAAYIGVMIDDLVTKDIIEPYRLFTSRAEFRLRLRQDNSDLRLSRLAYDVGLLDEKKFREFQAYADTIEKAATTAKETRISGKPVWEILKRRKGILDEQDRDVFNELGVDIDALSGRRVARQLLINAHYEGYIVRETDSVRRLRELENWRIPDSFDYNQIQGLRNESRMKLDKVKPTTLAQAGRIDGVTPAEIALLQVHLKRSREKE